MDIHSRIEQELQKIHWTRNRIGHIPNILILFLSIYFQDKNLFFDYRWFASIVFMVGGSTLAFYRKEAFLKQWEVEGWLAKVLNVVTPFLLAGAWGLHFSDIYYHYGALSPNVTYTLFILVSFITLASTTLAAAKTCYFVYMGTLLLSILLTYLLDPARDSSLILSIVILYFIFNVIHYHFAYQQLRHLVESKIKSNMEKDRLKYMMDAVPGHVALVDKNLICHMTNEAILLVFPDVIGKKVGMINSNSSWEKFIIDFMASPKKSEIAKQQDIINGQELHSLMSLQKTDDGGAIVVSLVINELVDAEKKIREQEAKAQYSAKLASLGEMAAGIAHEINNPLTVIQGSAHILNRIIDKGEDDSEAMKRLTSKIVETSDRISKTIKSLKTLSRNGEGDPMVLVPLTQVINVCLDLNQHRCKQYLIDLRVHETVPDLTVRGREVQLSQVMVNLLSNACDAVKELKERWIEIKIESFDKWVDIFVIDAGTGIPKELQDKIMEPFFTTKGVNEGTGLGLSISKNIIKDHGGELSYLAEEPHTTFKVRLPLC